MVKMIEIDKLIRKNDIQNLIIIRNQLIDTLCSRKTDANEIGIKQKIKIITNAVRRY